MKNEMACEVFYERTLTGSYMKVLSGGAGEKPIHDELVLEKCSLPGLLSMRTCLLNGEKQLWFQISGKQSLETFCTIRKIGIELIEQIIIQTCKQIETLESYLVDADCLCLHQEMIYVSNADTELCYAVLPRGKRPLQVQFRELMEYLLTKIDHADAAAVSASYRLYEKTLEEGYSIYDLREAVLQEHRGRPEIDPKQDSKQDPENHSEKYPEKYPERGMLLPGKTVENFRAASKEKKGIWKRFLNWLDHLIGEGEEDAFLISPDLAEKQAFRQEIPIYPTVCLAAPVDGARGILLYEGSDALPDIRLHDSCLQDNCEVIIGQAKDCSFAIAKETISLYHAKITRRGADYELEDMNSTNGTFLNGEMLPYHEKRILKSGDMVRFADQRFRFV